eukprot:CAMPEP_0168623684 /NCGR_PEP_ID=MMETSP0449_2-20121227/8964_1 /TAXON_ID=1082188 /ORGANISM="Strombidium rassoulzadegani, Strain ras09" /LENGTH=124 /DNA_ID=CAMNT_0008665097 /DNA_START=203 /DNA_END=577 /DNA_ORIENTATION=+
MAFLLGLKPLREYMDSSLRWGLSLMLRWTSLRNSMISIGEYSSKKSNSKLSVSSIRKRSNSPLETAPSPPCSGFSLLNNESLTELNSTMTFRSFFLLLLNRFSARIYCISDPSLNALWKEKLLW